MYWGSYITIYTFEPDHANMTTDPDKKKYFAITRAHTAPKTSAAANYTTSAVRLKKKQARHKEELRRISERKKNAIVKSGITNPRHSSLQAGTLARELGNIKGDAIDDLRCRAPVAAWDAEELVADIDRGIARPADHWRPCFPCFAWDPVRSALLISQCRRHSSDIRSKKLILFQGIGMSIDEGTIPNTTGITKMLSNHGHLHPMVVRQVQRELLPFLSGYQSRPSCSKPPPVTATGDIAWKL